MNISDRISEQFPAYIREDHPKFINFVENYYKFLESAELKLSGLSGTFTVGETVQGSISKSKAIVNSIDNTNSRIFVSTQNGFIPEDVISGSTSLASGKFVTYTPNPVQTIDQLLAYRDSDSSIDSFFDEFRKEFMSTIPKRLTNSLNRNNLIKSINTLYKSKGTTDGHKLFFKILFNEFSDVYYPAKDVLKPSHGEWVYDAIIRVYGELSDPSVLNGQTLHQLNDPSSTDISAASVTVEFAHAIYGSGIELNINKETIKGEFIAGEIGRIKGSDGIDYEFELAILPTKLTVSNPGQYYEVGEEIELLGFQFPPIVKIANTSLGSISSIDIINGGGNYVAGDKLVFTNTGAQGYGSKSADAEIEALGGQFTLEDATFTENNTFVLEDDSGFSILEDGYSLINESYYGSLTTNLVQEDYGVLISGIPSDVITQEDGTADISDISVTYGGQNYDAVPQLTISSELGESEELIPITENIAGVLDLDIFEPGFRYIPPNGNIVIDYGLITNDPITTENNGTVTLPNNESTDLGTLEYFSNVVANESLVIKEISGIIDPTIMGKSITSSSGGSGQVIKYTTSTKVLKVRKFSGDFNVGDTLTVGLNLGSCKIHLNETAKMKIETGVIFNYPGKYIGENGFVSSFAKRLQDSVYYQDYSYVVKIGRSINYWKEELKRTMHPVGFNLFGEVNVVSLINAGIKVPTFECTTFTPDLFSTLFVIFETEIKLPEIVSYGRYKVSRWDKQEHKRNSPIKRIEQFKFAQTDYLKNQSWDPNGGYDIHLEDNTGSIEAENGDLIIQQVRRWLHPDTSLYGGHVDRGYSIKFIDDQFPSISAVIDNPEVYTPITPPSEITIKEII
jgi:hypothetical protein